MYNWCEGKTRYFFVVLNKLLIKFIHQVVTTISTQHTTYGSPCSSSSSLKGDAERDFFIELWDVSGHERYKDCRSLFYSQINGEYLISLLEQIS